MSTIFRNPPSPALLEGEAGHYRSRGLRQNCFLAPPHSRNPPSDKNTLNSSGFASIGTPSASPFPSPSAVVESDYFSLNVSRSSTPATTPGSTTAYSQSQTPKVHFQLNNLKLSSLKLSSTATSSISLQPFISSDASSLASLFERCFSTDELRLAAKPPHKINTSDVYEEHRWRTAQYNMALKIPGNAIVKAVDTTSGKIVGAAGFFGPGGYQWMVRGEDGRPAVAEDVPSHWDRDMQVLTCGIIHGAREEVLRGDWGVWELAQLYVDPEYQRQGIGRMLLEWGLKQADEDDHPVYVEATPRAKAFYEQAGFASKAEPVFPGVVGEDGGEYEMYFMVRPVGGRS